MKRSMVRAFTVMEVLINILLTAIIIGMVYFIYLSFIKQIGLFEENIERQNDMEIFCLQLKKDFLGSEKIINSPNSFRMVFYDKGTVDYAIGKKFLYRKQNSNLDSLEVSNISREWDLNSRSGEQLLNKLSLEIVLFENSISYGLRKEYPFINSQEIKNGN